MNNIISPLLLVVILFLVSCSKEDQTGYPNYPTAIKTLSADQIDQIYSDLELTPLTQCTSVDNFGFLYVTLKNKDCGKFDSIYTNYSKQELIDSFYNSITRYGRFLNSLDTTGIKIASICNLNGIDYDKLKTAHPDSVTEGWIITSSQQKLNGYEIPGTELRVQLYFNKVRSVQGYRYSQLYIPVNDVYSEEKAKQSLLGKTITYNSSSLKITEATSWNQTEKRILTVTFSDRKELRYCWALRPSNWLVLVDTQTGELLCSEKI